MQGFRIYYANRSHADKTILGQSILIPATQHNAQIGICQETNNDEDALKILNTLENVVLINNIKKEYIIVNDCSTDNSEAIINQYVIHKNSPKVKLFSHSKNKGKGAAIKRGIEKSTGDYIIVQDADLEYDPKEFNLLLKPVIDGIADVVYGSRFVGGKPHRILFFWHTIGNNFLTFLSR